MTEPALRITGYTHVRELEYRLTGRTVLARHDATGDEVIIRYFTTELHADIEYREQVRHLVGRLSTVENTYLVRVREFVEEETVSAVVLEAPAAVTLRALLAYQGVVTAEAALYLLRGSLCGLATVHAAGVVHRGYRPESVLVDVDGQVRLLDAGMAGYRGAASVSVSAVADIHAAIAAFVEFLTADTTFTKTADLIAATPVTLRELVRFGLTERVDAVALLAMLDRVAAEQYGSEWVQRGRLWLAVRATELRIEELRAAAQREQERHEEAVAAAALGVLAATVVAGAASAASAAAQAVDREELRLRSLRAEEARLRAVRAEELRAAGLSEDVGLPSQPEKTGAVGRGGSAAEEWRAAAAGAVVGAVALAGSAAAAAGAVGPAAVAAGTPSAMAERGVAVGVAGGSAVAGVSGGAAGGSGAAAGGSAQGRAAGGSAGTAARRRRSMRWALVAGVVVLVLLVAGVALALSTGRSPAPTGEQGPAATPPAVPVVATSPTPSPSGALSQAAVASPSPSESPSWSPGPPFSPVPNQGLG